MRDKDITITPSIIDRMIDLEPNLSTEAQKSRSLSLEELKQSVRRDLEWLLNTRRTSGEIPEGLKEVTKSLATYGLPDITGLSSRDANNRKDLTKNIEKAIAFFEPRLIDVSVKFEDTDVVRRGVRFKIEASLRVDPTPEPVVFDTVMQAGSGEFEIS